MSLSDLSGDILTYIVTYGAFAVGAVLLLAAIGAPLPSTFFVIASGAFIQQGVLEPYSTVIVALVFVVLGDTISYGMGRLLRHPINRRFGQSATWQRAEQYFAKHGGVAVYLTRCLLTPIAVPLNLVAGSSGYATSRFVGFAATGELTWLALYGTLGYLFGSQWEAVSDFIGNFSGVLVGLLIAGIGCYVLLRWQRQSSEDAPHAELASGD
ncbi:MAG TPA: DedA family protein [Roseiflexaceae bacterium]|nr:DedA family protein [Roseiflexaceae bacterium]